MSAKSVKPVKSAQQIAVQHHCSTNVDVQPCIPMMLIKQTTPTPLGRMIECLHLAVATLYVSCFYIYRRLVPLLFLPGIFVDSTIGMPITQRYPFACLISTTIPTAYIALQTNRHPFGSSIWAIAIGTFIWLVLLFALFISHTAAIRFPRKVDQVGNAITANPVERWYSCHLKNPLDAFFIRIMMANSIVMIPAVLALVVPGTVGPYNLIFFLICFSAIGRIHDTLDHSDLHNNMFRNRHLNGSAKAIIWATGKFLRFILNPACERMPGFYRAQHLYVHHVENNSLDDVQTTLNWDRSSFLDYTKHALRMALSFSCPLDIYLYLQKKNKKRQARSVLLGFIGWYAYIGLIALYNPAAAAVIFIVRFFVYANFASQDSYYWHGLVDMEDPNNIYKNTLNTIPDGKTEADFIVSSQHIRHHLYGGEHWIRQGTLRDEDRYACEAQQALVFYDHPPHAFLKALWSKRYDKLAERVVSSTENMHSTSLAELIELRTRPLVAIQRGKFYRTVDHFFGAFIANYLIESDEPHGTDNEVVKNEPASS